MTSLVQFAQLFKNEFDLREKLAGLFRKMPHVQGVRVTHGSVERGKDLIFYSRDALGEWVLSACVVKNSPISGVVDSSSGAKTVLFQAQQALDSPIVGNDGSDAYAATVYIITPYECSQTAMLSVQGALQQRRGQVQFLSGSKLLDLFEQHSPETLIFDSSFLGSYVLQLQKKLRSIEPIRFLMQNTDLVASGMKSFESVYVRQDFSKTVSRFEMNSLITDQPSAMPENLSRDEYEFVFTRSEGLCSFVADNQTWEDGEEEQSAETSRQLVQALSEFKDQFVAKFDIASKSLRQINLTGQSQLIRVQVDEPLRHRVNDARLAAHRIVVQVASRVREANVWAVSASEIVSQIGGKKFLNYCRIEELARLHPNAIRRTDVSSRTVTSDLLSLTHSPILVTAAAGYGKTSFCKWQVLENIKSLEDRKTDVVPFYVALHQHATQELGTCEETFLQDPELISLLRTLNNEGKQMRIFLDGLDEVTTGTQQRKLMQLAEKLSKSYPHLQIVVTARKHVAGPWLRWLSRIDLAEMTEAQSRELIEKWLGAGTAECELFYEQLDRARTLEPLTRVPLLCTLVIAVFRRSGALPATRSSLYEIFVELMCGGWDLAKNIRRQLRFGVSQKKDVLTRLAGILHLDGRREGTEHDFRLAVGDVAMSTNSAWRDMLEEILEDSLITRMGGSLTFAHLSFQEYLAAKDLADPSGRRQATALREYVRGREWWAEVLAFYLSSSPRADEMEQWVTREFRKIKSRSADYERRMLFLLESIQSASEGWVPREHQFQIDFPVISRVQHVI